LAATNLSYHAQPKFDARNLRLADVYQQVHLVVVLPNHLNVLQSLSCALKHTREQPKRCLSCSLALTLLPRQLSNVLLQPHHAPKIAHNLLQQLVCVQRRQLAPACLLLCLRLEPRASVVRVVLKQTHQRRVLLHNTQPLALSLRQRRSLGAVSRPRARIKDVKRR
jgi:hypothetical protein